MEWQEILFHSKNKSNNFQWILLSSDDERFSYHYLKISEMIHLAKILSQYSSAIVNFWFLPDIYAKWSLAGFHPEFFWDSQNSLYKMFSCCANIAIAFDKNFRGIHFILRESNRQQEETPTPIFSGRKSDFRWRFTNNKDDKESYRFCCFTWCLWKFRTFKFLDVRTTMLVKAFD